MLLGLIALQFDQSGGDEQAIHFSQSQWVMILLVLLLVLLIEMCDLKILLI
jgi:hypothetical protein